MFFLKYQFGPSFVLDHPARDESFQAYSESRFMKKRFARVCALALVGITYVLARYPSRSEGEAEAVAARFRFEKIPLPESSPTRPQMFIRQVHPSLNRMAAWVSSLGAAASWADLDGDGLANDLLHVDPRSNDVFVSPAPGSGSRFVPFTLNPAVWSRNGVDGTTIAPTGTLVGDFNEDGRADFLVYFWGRSPILYLRRTQPSETWTSRSEAPAEVKSGTLEEASFQTMELVDPPERWYSNSAVQADFDGDGHVDVLVSNYFQDGSRILDPKAEGTVVLHEGKSKALNGGYKHFFLWQNATRGADPSVRFVSVSNFLREDVARGWTLAMAAADLDEDQLPEVYLANDFGPDRLLHNRSTPGHLQFEVLEGTRDFYAPKSCVLGEDSFKGMGADAADLNGDGHFDFYVSNIATPFALMESHFVWMSTGHPEEMKQGRAPYVNQSEQLGLSRSGFAWDAKVGDFDNDGDWEALQACGFIRGSINRWPELQSLGTSNARLIHSPKFWPNFKPGTDLSGNDTNPFFVRFGDGRYYDIANRLGLADPMVTRGIAISDVDGDGRLDFVCANQWGPSFFFKNQSPGKGSFLSLVIHQEHGSPAYGARVRVTRPDGRTLVSQVDGGNGHSGRRSPEVHFGLGVLDAKAELRVAVSWRDRTGKPQHYDGTLTPGRHILELSRFMKSSQTSTAALIP